MHAKKFVLMWLSTNKKIFIFIVLVLIKIPGTQKVPKVEETPLMHAFYSYWNTFYFYYVYTFLMQFGTNFLVCLNNIHS